MKFNKKHLYIISSIFIALLIFVVLHIYNYSIKVSSIIPSKDKLLIHYIDVGQGDAILIQFNDKSLLIDSGSKDANISSYLKRQRLKRINYIVATHPHEDHIGNMHKIIKNYDIDAFYSPNIISNTDTFKDMVLSLNEKNLKISPITSETQINLGENISFRIMPSVNNYDNINNYSLVVKLIYKNTSFLFSGDAESLREEEILDKGYNLRADVLKIGHHGSKTSTTKRYLEEVKPKVAVISCGKGNDYGHPHKETLLKLKEKGIITYRTDINSTIILESDGDKIVKRK